MEEELEPPSFPRTRDLERGAVALSPKTGRSAATVDFCRFAGHTIASLSLEQIRADSLPYCRPLFQLFGYPVRNIRFANFAQGRKRWIVVPPLADLGRRNRSVLLHDRFPADLAIMLLVLKL